MTPTLFTSLHPLSNAERYAAWRRKNGPLRAQIERQLAAMDALNRRVKAAGGVVMCQDVER